MTAAVPPDPAIERIVTNPRQLRRSWYVALTLFLHGVGDRCLGIEVARDGARELAAGSRFVEVEGAGHFLHLEQPGAVNRHILDFVTAG